MATTRDALQDSLHRLANFIECQLPDIYRELLAASMPGEANDVSYHACSLIQALRDIRDAKGGAE